MKSSHSHCRRLYCTAESFTTQQTALLHSRRFYCMTESFIAQQKALLDNRKFYCAIEDFIAQQKVLPYSRKVNIVVETGEKFLLQQEQRISPLCHVFPRLGLSVCAQTCSGRVVLWSPFCRALGPTSFSEKAQTKHCPITSKRVSKVQET